MTLNPNVSDEKIVKQSWWSAVVSLLFSLEKLHIPKVRYVCTIRHRETPYGLYRKCTVGDSI